MGKIRPRGTVVKLFVIYFIRYISVFERLNKGSRIFLYELWLLIENINIKTFSILKLALISDLEKKIQLRLEDLQKLKVFTKVCIIFGSYIHKKNLYGCLKSLMIE